MLSTLMHSDIRRLRPPAPSLHELCSLHCRAMQRTAAMQVPQERAAQLGPANTQCGIMHSMRGGRTLWSGWQCELQKQTLATGFRVQPSVRRHCWPCFHADESGNPFGAGYDETSWHLEHASCPACPCTYEGLPPMARPFSVAQIEMPLECFEISGHVTVSSRVAWHGVSHGLMTSMMMTLRLVICANAYAHCQLKSRMQYAL